MGSERNEIHHNSIIPPDNTPPSDDFSHEIITKSWMETITFVISISCAASKDINEDNEQFNDSDTSLSTLLNTK